MSCDAAVLWESHWKELHGPQMSIICPLKLPIQGQLLEKLLIQISYTQLNHWFQRDYFTETSQKKVCQKLGKVNCLMWFFFSLIEDIQETSTNFSWVSINFHWSSFRGWCTSENKIYWVFPQNSDIYVSAEL